LPILFEARSPCLSASMRVRLHGRDRLPELTLSLVAATVTLFIGIAASTPPTRNSEGDEPMIEMRSVATEKTPLAARDKVRIIPLDTVATYLQIDS
jgi:hypothetical protein